MESVVRITLIYLFLMVGLRLMGKREFGELAPFELIPEILTDALTRNDSSLTTGILGVSTLLSLVFVTSVVSYRFQRVGRWTEGEPMVLVKHGYLVPSVMHRERVSPDEVHAEMHRPGSSGWIRSNGVC